jgi:hypothetical protein
MSLSSHDHAAARELVGMPERQQLRAEGGVVSESFLRRRQEIAMRTKRELLRASEDEDAAVAAFEAAVSSAWQALDRSSGGRGRLALRDDQGTPARSLLRGSGLTAVRPEQMCLDGNPAANHGRTGSATTVAISLAALPSDEEGMMMIMASSSKLHRVSERERVLAMLAAQQLARPGRSL